MIRLRLFGRCRIYHDPVSPVLRAPAQVGWTAWFRDIDLVTPQKLKGEELLKRTRGWWTVEPNDIAEVVQRFGRLVVGDQGELMVEFADEKAAADLAAALRSGLGRRCSSPRKRPLSGSFVKWPSAVSPCGARTFDVPRGTPACLVPFASCVEPILLAASEEIGTSVPCDILHCHAAHHRHLIYFSLLNWNLQRAIGIRPCLIRPVWYN